MMSLIPLLICSFLLSTSAPGVGAASRSSRNNKHMDEERRRARGATSSKGPRGSNRRHLQDIDAMGATLSEGYGGQGGVTKNEESLPTKRETQAPTVAPATAAVPATTVPATPAPVTAVPATPAPVTTAPITPAPTIDGRNVTYFPGQLTVMERDLILSQGLTSRIIALSGKPVLYADGTTSVDDYHFWPDGAGTFVDYRAGNEGGWLYLSNVEDKEGGVGALTFDKDGGVIKYEMILTGTTYNCNGGRTPWGTWITAEEDFDKLDGQVWQVDPYNVRPAVPINMGLDGGAYEAFAYDIRNLSVPRFYLTEDNVFGALERFTPTNPTWGDPWNLLIGPGVNEWLILTPTSLLNPNVGTYSWTTDLEVARINAGSVYPESEGIDVAGSNLFFVCKGIKMLFTLDLDGNTYIAQSTSEGLFEGEPDTVRTIMAGEASAETLLYFTEDNGRRAGVHARNEAGELLTILEGFYSPETTGLAVSPNGMFLYVCFQEDGYCFEIKRTDGLSFRAKTLNVKRHPTEVGSSKATRSANRFD